MLTTPPVKEITLLLPLEKVIKVKKVKGVTVKDALDAVGKGYKNRVGGRSSG